jgi:hypothetical protein
MHLTLIARVPLDPSLVLQIPERRVEREFPEHSAATSRVVDGHIAVALAGVAAIDVGKGTLTGAPPRRRVDRVRAARAGEVVVGDQRGERPTQAIPVAYLREFSFGRVPARVLVRPRRVSDRLLH